MSIICAKTPFLDFLDELRIVMGEGLAIFVCFVKVCLEHFYHFNMLKYLLTLRLQGKVTHLPPTARIIFQGDNTVTRTAKVIFFILGWVNHADNTPSKRSIIV